MHPVLETALKTQGIKPVSLDAAADWKIKYRAAVEALPTSFYTGEDIRALVEPIIGAPDHPNAWGGAFQALVRGNNPVLVGIGRYVKMKSSLAHGRRTQVYRKVR